MTFKIHQVYKQSSGKKIVKDSEQKEEKEENQSDPKNLSLSSSLDSSTPKAPKNLQQMRNDVLNSRSAVKPGTKNGIRPTAFEGGLEADMY